MENVRILISELTDACIWLGEVKVLAAGSMYATLETNEYQRKQLSKIRINWSLDT